MNKLVFLFAAGDSYPATQTIATTPGVLPAFSVLGLVEFGFDSHSLG